MIVIAKTNVKDMELLIIFYPILLFLVKEVPKTRKINDNTPNEIKVWIKAGSRAFRTLTMKSVSWLSHCYSGVLNSLCT